MNLILELPLNGFSDRLDDPFLVHNFLSQNGNTCPTDTPHTTSSLFARSHFNCRKVGTASMKPWAEYDRNKLEGGSYSLDGLLSIAETAVERNIAGSSLLRSTDSTAMGIPQFDHSGKCSLRPSQAMLSTFLV